MPYFCHACRSNTTIDTNSSEFRCSTCHSEFVEEMVGPSAQVIFNAPPPSGGIPADPRNMPAALHQFLQSRQNIINQLHNAAGNPNQPGGQAAPQPGRAGVNEASLHIGMGVPLPFLPHGMFFAPQQANQQVFRPASQDAAAAAAGSSAQQQEERRAASVEPQLQGQAEGSAAAEAGAVNQGPDGQNAQPNQARRHLHFTAGPTGFGSIPVNVELRFDAAPGGPVVGMMAGQQAEFQFRPNEDFAHFIETILETFGMDAAGAGGQSRARRVPQEQIDTLPNSKVQQKHVDSNVQCTTCMDEFTTVGDQVAQLNCGHIFHVPCIVPWLESHVTCPVCRAPIDLSHQLFRDVDELD